MIRNKYVVSFRIGFQSSLEYRFNFFLSLLSAFFPMIVQYYIWTAVYASSGENVVFGYSYQEIIMYTILAAVVSKLVITNIEYSIAEDIKSGGLNKYIIQPIYYFGYRISSYIGQRLIYFIISILLIVSLTFALNNFYQLQMMDERMILFFFTLFLAIILSFLISYAVCAVAFWLSEISYFFVVTSLLINIMSGGMFPLEIFGERVQLIFRFMPFYYLIYFPVNLLNGRISGLDMWQGMIGQGVWVVLMLLICHLVWKLGMKRYLGLGG
ncbi:ABC-2 family transporter protein [Paenibacillus sp. Marseille-Q4541]|uniref:ABC transporter permease n=1 Tax=Paenibacillus sp. Marseille-Q4541 TaxID=2831522 RepID=UPI001BA9ECF9|nr:ABC-2 family transporter protein [Paenibacillus sp. Marseille-Q4541]